MVKAEEIDGVVTALSYGLSTYSSIAAPPDVREAPEFERLVALARSLCAIRNNGGRFVFEESAA